MRVATVFIVLCFCTAKISASIYGVEINTIEEWWTDGYFLKFNSPSGKTFYIDIYDGKIHREKEPQMINILDLESPESPSPTTELISSETEAPQTEEKNSPFISFVSIDLKIYDIYFENDDTPRIEGSEFNYTNKYLLIRHRLDSFVGPNKKLYQVIYNDGVDPNIDIIEKTSEALDHFQIKTFGPYEKWEHTYDFSENGELVLDHTLSPIPVLPNRSIPLPKLEPSSIIQNIYIDLLATFDTPSGIKYHITNQLNIVPISQDDAEEDEEAYITFTEPDGRTYDIRINEEDSHPFLVEKKLRENFFRTERLYSFVGPNKILYRIDHKNETDHEVPILVENASESSDLQITFVRQERYYNMYVKYIFSDNGTTLFDRVDEIDWTPLNEQPAIPVQEVQTDEIADLPFLTFYSSSGNLYHIFINQTNASIAVEKGTKNTQPSLYIDYLQTNGIKTHIYFTPGDHPYLEEEANQTIDGELLPFFLVSFVAPDQKQYSIKSQFVNDTEWKEYVELPPQVREPIDAAPVDGLTIRIQSVNTGQQYVYRFTWNGDKLIEASLLPPIWFVGTKVLGSLIGK